MRSLVLLLALLLALSLISIAHAEPAADGPTSAQAVAARKKLDGFVAKADQTQFEAIASAREAYLSSLKQALDAAMNAASLDAAKWAKAEIERIKAGEPASAEKPKLAAAAAAQSRFLRAGEKAQEDRKRSLDAARKQYITELEAAKRTALSIAKDLDEAGRIAAEIDRAKVMEFGQAVTTPSVGGTPLGVAVGERTPGKINLLKIVDIDRDPILYGVWKWDNGNLLANGDGWKTIRLPYLPSTEYDFIAEFTITKLRGADFDLVCVAGDSSFLWISGGWANTVCCFAPLNGAWDRGNPTTTRIPQGVFEPGRRTRIEVSVRRNELSASIDGKSLARVQTDFKNLNLHGHQEFLAAGIGVLGLCIYNDVVIHAIEVVEIGSPGKVIRRLNAQQMEAQAQVFKSLRFGKSASLTELRPRAVQVGWSTFMINQNPEGLPVTINGRDCGRYLFAVAPSSIVYNIPDGAIGFRAVATRPAGTYRGDLYQWRVGICVDDCEVFLSRGIRESGGQINVEVPLPKGAQQIELRGDPMGNFDGNRCIWANPEFLFPQ